MSEKILVPDIGDFENVEVIEILVKPGDQIKENDPIVTIESDKSSVEIPSTVSGKVDNVTVKVGDKVSKGDLLLNLTSKTSPESILPKDTENIIKQAEEAIAEKKEEKKIIRETVVEKKQPTIQVVNGSDIDPLETQDWLESLSAVISKDGNHRAHFLIKELINKAYREGANIPYTQNTPYINTIPPEAEVKSSGDQTY
jgi:Pyruvate dehydrogenase complex, dehydrogenase (E1) component